MVAASDSESPAPSDELLRLLAAEQLEAVDKRAAGGALWVVGGRELEPTMTRLASQGHRFNFSEGGGRATKHRPAWWTKAAG